MKKKEIFWGLLFLLAAALIIFNQFGYFEEISMYELVAAVILGGIMLKSLLHLNFWGILFPAAFLCIIFADEWNITDFTPWPALLTALLLCIGLSIIFKRPSLLIYHFHKDHSFSKNVIDSQDDNIINFETSFGESIKYVNTENFEKANLKCSFGNLQLYFDHAQIPSGKADIYVDVSFGEATLFIPKNWKIINDVHAFLGDMDERGRSIDENSPEVKIHGTVSFGSVKIIYN